MCLMRPNFLAPTEDIELEIVEYCINVLQLDFASFWYQWFDSSKTGNHTMHITCNKDVLDGLIRTFQTMSFVKEVLSIKKLDVHAYEDDIFLFYIHFKSNFIEKTPSQ